MTWAGVSIEAFLIPLTGRRVSTHFRYDEAFFHTSFDEDQQDDLDLDQTDPVSAQGFVEELET